VAAGVMGAAGSIGATVSALDDRLGVPIGEVIWVAGDGATGSDDAVLAITGGVVDGSDDGGNGTVAGGWTVGDADRWVIGEG
jgi:hypothetical protein